jgi:ABC-type multidrug transport system ATPase subunit/pSer/pThr/pTyr-binding forkhead associated (FHA) protein
MTPAFGKDQIGIGSAPDNDVVIATMGVAPHHARIVRQAGQLMFVDLGVGATTANNAPVAPQQPVPFDFRTVFAVGGVPVPLSHPAICTMLMSAGQLQPPRGHLVVGRDAARASLVLSQAAVSGQHATVMLDRMVAVDHSSTSGTWVAGRQLPPNQPVPIDPNGVIAFGPVIVPVAVLAQVAQGALAGAPPAPPAPSSGSGGVLSAAPAATPSPQGALAAAPMQGHAPAAFGPAHGPPASVAAPPLGPAPAPPAAAPGGAPVGAPAAPAVGAPGGPRKHRTVIGELKLDELTSNVVTIGRTPDNQIVLNHPQVSSRHAQIVKSGAQLFLEDRGSANGTYVRGQRLPPGQRVPVVSGEKVFIGPMPLLIHIAESRVNVVVEDHVDWAGKPLYEIEAWDLYLEVPDRDDKSQMKVLLDHVSFRALPGDMIALMGPSGAGKTTLLLALNGYLPPTSGQVRINGEDLYTIYDALRGSIGYVPQDDIVHPELTVFEAVKYSARFRLPPDYSEDEIDRRVDDTLRDLGLEGVRNLQIGKPEKKVLSGGQRKRVNIALELVTDPVILFLDEPTSGLAADDTTALISLLADLTKKTGKTIVMTIHQPAKDEFEKFNLAFIMGYGGVPTYFGPSGETAYSFFGSLLGRAGAMAASHKRVDNPRDMFDMLNLRERLVLEEMKRRNPNAARQLARTEAAKGWRAEFFRNDSPLFQQMFSGRRAIGTAPSARGVPHRADVAVVRQFGLLLSRYWKVKLRDRMGAAIMFLQAPIIGVLLWLVFGAQTQAVPYWCLGALQELSKKNEMSESATTNLLNSMERTTDHTAAMFFVVVSCVWFGTSNAAREIVTERAIYLRERMVNLRLYNYVLSKYMLLSFFCVLQCGMLLAIVFFSLGFDGGPVAFAMELANLVALAMNATALGLCISTMVSSAEAAMALTPIALIPQVVLGGLMVPMTTNPNLRFLMYATPARWGFEGAIAIERLAISSQTAWNIDLHKPDLTSLPDFVQNGRFQCAIAQVASDTINGAWGFTEWDQPWLPAAVLFGMTFLLIIVLLIALKRRDPV